EPEWQHVYEERVRPNLKRLLGKLPALRARGLTADFLQYLRGPNGEKYEARFIPERGQEEQCLEPEAIRDGVARLREYLASDADAPRKGLRRVKLYFDPERGCYVVLHVEYADGSDVNVA